MCPLCNRKVNVRKDHINYTLCEEWFDCVCGYSYEFAYGAERWFYGPFEVRESGWRDRLLRLVWQVWTFDGCLPPTPAPPQPPLPVLTDAEIKAFPF